MKFFDFSIPTWPAILLALSALLQGCDDAPGKRQAPAVGPGNTLNAGDTCDAACQETKAKDERCAGNPSLPECGSQVRVESNPENTNPGTLNTLPKQSENQVVSNPNTETNNNNNNFGTQETVDSTNNEEDMLYFSVSQDTFFINEDFFKPNCFLKEESRIKVHKKNAGAFSKNSNLIRVVGANVQNQLRIASCDFQRGFFFSSHLTESTSW